MMQLMFKTFRVNDHFCKQCVFITYCVLFISFTSTVSATQVTKFNDSSLYVNYAKDFNSVLLSELYHQLGDSKLSIQHYMALAKSNDDPLISKRATEIASRTRQPLKGLEMAQRWIELSPNSLSGHQYLALLLLRDNQFKKSSIQLKKIIQLVDQEIRTKKQEKKPVYSKGLKFIGAMLLIETNHDKALRAYDFYLTSIDTNLNVQSPFQAQRLLIRASLADKAKDYESTLDAIDKYEGLNIQKGIEQHSVLIDIVRMKIKALQELNKVNLAVSYLTKIIDEKKGNDSLQLELVRLLLMNKQRSRAAPYLQELVTKHPDNNDLLKSLIALQIDQLDLTNAQSNIKILNQSPEYVDDAKYFKAELLEAQGSFEHALKSYKEVSGGILFEKAKLRANHLALKLKKTLKKKVNQTKYKIDTE